jgi:hypothetical protein
MKDGGEKAGKSVSLFLMWQRFCNILNIIRISKLGIMKLAGMNSAWFCLFAARIVRAGRENEPQTLFDDYGYNTFSPFDSVCSPRKH